MLFLEKGDKGGGNMAPPGLANDQHPHEAYTAIKGIPVEKLRALPAIKP